MGRDWPQEAEFAELPLLPELVLFLPRRLSWVSGLASEWEREVCWLLSGEWVMACKCEEVNSAMEMGGNSNVRLGELGGMVWKDGKGIGTSVCRWGDSDGSG